MTGDTSGEGVVELLLKSTLDFWCDSCCSIFCVLYSILSVCSCSFGRLFLFFWPLCCLSFYDLHLMLTPLVSLNFSCTSIGQFIYIPIIYMYLEEIIEMYMFGSKDYIKVKLKHVYKISKNYDFILNMYQGSFTPKPVCLCNLMT